MVKDYLILIAAFFMSVFVQAQTYELSGEVKDNDGLLVPGANVMISSLNKGTVTDVNGKFKLEVPQGSYTLKVTYLGFNDYEKEVTVNDDINIKIKLQLGNYMLEGIMVTAQKREQKNKEVPISITSYGKKFLQNTNTFEYDQLSEYVPGLQVQIQSVNNPGIVIRGITSDNGDSRVEPGFQYFKMGCL